MGSKTYLTGVVQQLLNRDVSRSHLMLADFRSSSSVVNAGTEGPVLFQPVFQIAICCKLDDDIRRPCFGTEEQTNKQTGRSGDKKKQTVLSNTSQQTDDVRVPADFFHDFHL